MDRCVQCGAELGVGRFCLNCGHPKGQPPTEPTAAATPAPPPPAARTTPPVTPPEAEPDMDHAPSSTDETGTVAAEEQSLPPDPSPEPTPSPEPQWDPRRDLLPLEEVDDVDRDAPLRGKAWIGWVLGAVLVVALALLLLQKLGIASGTLADPGTSPSSDAAPQTVGESGSGTGATDKGVGKRINLARSARVAVPGTAPPTTDFDGTTVAYEASQMRDGKSRTAWRIAGDATGKKIVVTMPRPAVVQRVGLINGYAKKVAGVDWYPNNRRILSVTWAFDDGTTRKQTFDERPGRQKINIPHVTTKKVRITITSVSPPGGGSLGRDYTAISEVTIIGKRAG